jgi:hypothetical protein
MPQAARCSSCSSFCSAATRPPKRSSSVYRDISGAAAMLDALLAFITSGALFAAACGAAITAHFIIELLR